MNKEFKTLIKTFEKINNTYKKNVINKKELKLIYKYLDSEDINDRLKDIFNFNKELKKIDFSKGDFFIPLIKIHGEFMGMASFYKMTYKLIHDVYFNYSENFEIKN